MNSWCIYKKSKKKIEKLNFYSQFRFFVEIRKNAVKNCRFFLVFLKIIKTHLKIGQIKLNLSIRSLFWLVLGGSILWTKLIRRLLGGQKGFFCFWIFPKISGYIFRGWSGGSPEIFFAKNFFSPSTLNIFRKSQEKWKKYYIIKFSGIRKIAKGGRLTPPPPCEIGLRIFYIPKNVNI